MNRAPTLDAAPPVQLPQPLGRLAGTVRAEARPEEEVERRQRALALALGGLGAGAVAMSLAARRLPHFPGDPEITRALQDFHHPVVDFVMKAVSAPGYGALNAGSTIGAASALLALGYRREALFTALTITADWLNALIKLVVQRPRPSAEQVRVFFRHRARSYPSGHVMHYTTLFGFLLYTLLIRFRPSPGRRALTALFGSLVLLVGPSRVYLGAHWASDVVAGYTIGAFWLALLILVYGETAAASLPHSDPGT
jgi:undecaprenyl-diphosphatase